MVTAKNLKDKGLTDMIREIQQICCSEMHAVREILLKKLGKTKAAVAKFQRIKGMCERRLGRMVGCAGYMRKQIIYGNIWNFCYHEKSGKWKRRQFCRADCCIALVLVKMRAEVERLDWSSKSSAVKIKFMGHENEVHILDNDTNEVMPSAKCCKIDIVQSWSVL